MTLPPIIGLHGVAGAGKDTAGAYILEWAEEQGLVAVRRGFADRLKVSAAHALGFEGDTDACIEFCNELKQDGSYLNIKFGADPPEQYKQITGREYLQFYGTEAHRGVFGEDFWVDAALPSNAPAHAPWSSDLYVVTDVRFKNEALGIRNRGGEVWRVIRADAAGAGQHASERPLDNDLITINLPNDGTRDELRRAVRERLNWRLNA